MTKANSRPDNGAAPGRPHTTGISRTIRFCSTSLLILVLACPWPTQALAATSEWLPIKIYRGHVVIPVVIEGVKGAAMLDTGSMVNSISPRFIDENDLDVGRGGTTNVAGVVKARRVGTHNNVRVDMYGINLELDRVTEARTEPFDLVLGLGMIAGTIAQIDYPQQRIRFMDHDSFDHRKMPNTKMKKENITGLPIVRVNLNDDKKAWLILDTGNSGGLLITNDIAGKYDWVQKYGTGVNQARGTHGVAATFDSLLLPRLEFGPFELPNVPTATPAPGQSLELSRTFDQLMELSGHVKSRIRRKGTVPVGLLGYEVLRHFVVTIDYAHNKLRLDMPELVADVIDYESLVGESIGDLISHHGRANQTTEMGNGTKQFYWLLSSVGIKPSDEAAEETAGGAGVCEMYAFTDSWGRITEITRDGNGC